MKVGLGLVPIVAGICQDIKERRLSVLEHIFLKGPIARFCIVVGFLQTQIGLLIMGTVGYHRSSVVGVHLQDLRGIEDTGIAQRLAYRV